MKGLETKPAISIFDKKLFMSDIDFVLLSARVQRLCQKQQDPIENCDKL